MFNKIQTDTPIAKLISSVVLETAAGIILCKFYHTMPRNNLMCGTPEMLAAKLNLSMWEFNIGIRQLKQLDAIRKYSAREYMVNPDLGYNGEEKRYWVLKHLWDTQTKSGLHKT